ncbi:MAG: hypothetical protein ACHREM_13325 [Polyangiales bacterium]
MIDSLCRPTCFIAAVALLAAAAGGACNSAPPAASPQSGTSPAASASGSAKAPIVGPAIVGAVTVASTKEPPAAGVVYLEDAPKQPGVAMAASIDVFHKEFTPLISVVTTGGAVTFGNRDGLPHHVFSPDIKGWDTGLLLKGQTVPRTLDSPGAFAFLCNLHPEMISFVLVIPSTYFAKLAADGTYAITNVPPGTYKATAWAPRIPTVTMPVTVSGTGIATANFELRLLDK